MLIMLRMLFSFVLVVFIAGCATKELGRQDPLSGDEYLVEVERLKAELKRRPQLVENRTQLSRMEARAIQFFYESGKALQKDGLMENALREFQQGLLVSPRSERLAQAVASVMAKIEAERYYSEGLRSIELERVDEAHKAFSTTLQLVPEHLAAAQALKDLRTAEASPQSALDSSEANTLSFQRADVRVVYEFLGKAFGLNILFDEGLKNAPVTLYAEGVTVKQALELLTATTETFFKQIGPNTLLVAQESPQKRAQYDEFIIRTFYLRVIPAKDMAAIIKGVLNPKQMIVSEQLNSIMVRDTESVLGLVDSIVKTNDLRPAELIFDVEILEINRNKVEQLGIDYGSRISMSFPQNETSLRSAIVGGTYTLPAVSLQYLKQDIDARTLANPQIRVVHGSSAQIHIGDRIPLRSSSIQDATGQVRTTFEYRDVGIRLAVEPYVHLDNSVSVKLGLEVSSLGQNLGTQNEPAYSIGTRNAETQMLLQDGETAVLGGLIKDEDRNSVTRLPGLGSIPVLGRLFRIDDKSAGTTDVLLTITPRIVRAWGLPERGAREVYSGTERRYSGERMFAEMATIPVGRSAPVISVLEETPDAETIAPAAVPSFASSSRDSATNNESSSAVMPVVAVPLDEPNDVTAPRLTFGESLYSAAVGQDIPVDVVYHGPAHSGSLEFHVLYNPRIVEVSSQTGGAMMDVSVVNEGTAVITLPSLDLTDENGVVGQLTLRSLSSGASYLAYRVLQQEEDTSAIQTTSARIQVE